MSAALEIQKAVFLALRADAPLTALLPASAIPGDVGSAIYDQAPQPADAGSAVPFPYVVIGETDEDEFDTDDSIGRESVITLHTFSAYRGQKEAKNIMDAIKAVLHNQPLAVVGQITVLVLQEFSQVAVEPDGVTRHGVQRVRIVTEGT